MSLMKDMGLDLKEATYLGDSVFFLKEARGFWLFTHNGYPDDPRNEIFFEPEVWAALRQQAIRH